MTVRKVSATAAAEANFRGNTHAGSVLSGFFSRLTLKNSIEEYPDEYDVLFDGLKPKRYKYNNGTSDRYHTGFIAQDVVESLEDAGLTTQDFAAVVLRGMGTEDEYWALRRDEFVSLNTWQIQKLKKRVQELEDKISLLLSAED